MNNNLDSQESLLSAMDKKSKINYDIVFIDLMTELLRISPSISIPGPPIGRKFAGLRIDKNTSIHDVSGRLMHFALDPSVDIFTSLDELSCALDTIQHSVDRYEPYLHTENRNGVKHERVVFPHVAIYWLTMKRMVTPHDKKTSDEIDKVFLSFDPFQYLYDYLTLLSSAKDGKQAEMLQGDSGIALAILCAMYADALYFNRPGQSEIGPYRVFSDKELYIRVLGNLCRNTNRDISWFANVMLWMAKQVDETHENKKLNTNQLQ